MSEQPPSRIRVGYFLSPSQHFAGIERVVHEVASGLAAAHPLLLDIHVIFSSGYDEEVLRETAYHQHILGVSRLREVGLALRTCVAEQRIEVLVIPQVEASVLAWVATRRLPKLVVVPHLHGNPRLEEAEGTRRTKVAFRLFRTIVARSVPVVLAVSPSLVCYAQKTLARRSTVAFAPNPVRDLGSPMWHPSMDEAFRFVCVGRLSRQKGQDLLLRALAKVRADLPLVTLTLVGDGPEEAQLRALSAELGLDDIVTFAGYTSEPAHYLAAADCFVLASRWEGFGVAIVEALQCGLPVLATDCDFGPADVVVEPSLGALVAPDDPTALAGGLLKAVGWTRTDEEISLRRAAASAYDRRGAIAAHFSILRSVAPHR